jgi:prepilin-type N-terminal cleavage/methylation domain-containing protein
MEQDKNQKKSKKGFSIMELMIAIFVLSVGITGALKLIVATISNSIDTRNAVVASGLAQEGVELVRNIRDNNMLYALADLSRDRETTFKSHGLPPNNADNFNCVFSYDIVYSSLAGINCSANASDAAAKLYLSATGNYTHTALGNPETVFRRYVNLFYVNDGDDFLNPNPTGMNVVSYVWWGSDARPAPCNLAGKCIEVKDYLPKRD